MKRVFTSLAGVALMLLVFGSAMAISPTITIQEKEGIGKYLADSEGKTLYWFKKDAVGKSACSGPCVEKWPLYDKGSATVPKGTKAEEFGAITREDGKKQTTFRGYPLYYWAGDKKSGDTNGQGVNNVWYVINPDNFPPK